MSRCGSECTSGNQWLARIVAVVTVLTLLLLAAMAPASVMASSTPSTVVIHVRDLAHYKLSYMRQVDRAVQHQVNHELRRLWHTRPVRFDVPSTRMGPPSAWQVDVLPTAIVRYGFFNRANGFHLNDSPTYIQIAGLSKTIPMSVILSHEVIEALIDPTGTKMTHGVLTEVCDAVEQPGYRVDGVGVSNFVTPAWFGKSGVSDSFDFEGLLTHPLSTTLGGFMPGG